MGNAPQTLCWDCRNSTEKGCSWSRWFEPVEGWEAVQTKKSIDGYSYIVLKCPQFIRDSWHYGTYRTKDEYKKYLDGKEKRRKILEEKEARRDKGDM